MNYRAVPCAPPPPGLQHAIFVLLVLSGMRNGIEEWRFGKRGAGFGRGKFWNGEIWHNALKPCF